MNKTLKNKEKDRLRKRNWQWVDLHTKIEDRTTGSGMQFGGKYIQKTQVK